MQKNDVLFGEMMLRFSRIFHLKPHNVMCGSIKKVVHTSADLSGYYAKRKGYIFLRNELELKSVFYCY